MSNQDPTGLEAGIDRVALKQRSVSGLAATLAAQLAKLVLKFGSTVVMARLLGPSEFGILAMVTPILAFVASINDIGFSQAIIRDHNLDKSHINSLFWLNFAISAALMIILSLSSPLVANLYHENRITIILPILSTILIFNMFATVPTAILLRDMRFPAAAASDVAGLTASVISTVAFAYFGFSYWSLVIGQLVGACVTAVLAIALSGWWPSAPGITSETGKIARFGANLTGVNIAGFVSMTADNMIVGAFAGKVALGLYDRSYALTLQPLTQLLSAFNRISLPLLSRVRSDEQLYRKTFVQMLKFSFILTTPVMLFCIFFSRPFIEFLWGPRWIAAAPVFFWFSVGGIVAPIFPTTSWLFASEGRTNLQFRLAVATAAISVASFLAGIPWGPVGVVRVNAFTFILLQTPLMIWGASRGKVIRISDFTGAIAPFVIPLIVTGAALFAVADKLPGWMTLIGLPLAYLVFSATVFVLPGGRAFWTTIWRLLLNVRGNRQPTPAAG